MKKLTKITRVALMRAAVLAAEVLLMAGYAGCGSGSNGDDVVNDLTVLDADVRDTMAGDTATDTIADGEAGDVANDANGPDEGADIQIPTDIAADTANDAPGDTGAGDAGGDATNLDECKVHQECDDCQLCLDEGAGKKCTMVLWEEPECVNNDDCMPPGRVCRPTIPGKPGCGGSCQDNAVYTLHEWGVNTVTPADGASAHAGPRRYYDAMDRKPVIYIYSEDAFSLDIGVQYRDGTSSETWPEIPASPWVIWKDVQVGTGDCTPSATPPVDWTGQTPAMEAWELPDWVVNDANCLTVGDTISKLLFYAGPFTEYQPGVEALLTRVDTLVGSVTLTNNLTDPIGPVIVLYRDAESTCAYYDFCPVHTATIGWKVIDSLAAGATATESLEWDYEHVEPTDQEPTPSVNALLPAGWTDLRGALRTALGDKGLTEAETNVFMSTWTDTMFGLHGNDADPLYPEYRQGAALIYLWPDSRTAEKLPLTAVPAPTDTVRAMVEYQQVQTVELL